MAEHCPPLRFTPILVPKVWGGRRLARFGKDLPADAAIGESWEIADLPDSVVNGRSIIRGGPHDGKTLRDLIREEPHAILGSAAPTDDGGFPLLIKFLDASENLSVQVHPDENYAAAHEDAYLKSEAWIILDAEPGATIYKGLEPNVTPEQFRAHIEDGTVVDDLIEIPVQAGDCHYLPSGTCHALGAGILVAEVQTPSDTTFRVFDWGRTDRELHIEQSMKCITFGAEPEDEPDHPVVNVGGMSTTLLVETDHFTIERIDAATDSALPVATSGQPVIWIVLEGSVDLCRDDVDGPMGPGSTVLFPACTAGVTARIERQSRFLRVSLPSPARGLLA